MKTNGLLRNYNLIKRKYDKAVVLIRHGNTYITFKEDAQCLAGITGGKLNLTNSAIPTYCSQVNVKQLNDVIHSFAQKSLTVAVCDPVEMCKDAVD